MVVWSKIVPLIAAGVGVMFLINAFTRPAHATQTAGALTETVSSIGGVGSAISSIGTGIGSGLAGLFQPVWEVANLFERFSTLSAGAANVSPVSQDLGGYIAEPDAPTWTTSSGGSSSLGAGTVTNVPPSVTVTGTSPGSTWSFL
tara:strand:- start:97 stop:531 length:435 start_codon:yes stop_codon:yes gene_type:complete